MKKKNKLIILICILVIVIGILCILLDMSKKNNEDNSTNELDVIDYYTAESEDKIKIVKNATDFFTAVSCVDKYLDMWYEGDNEKIYNTLSEDFIKENNITKENVLEKIGYLDKMYTYTGKKMYYEETDNAMIIKIYAYGIANEVADVEDKNNVEEKELYINLIINYDDCTFKIIPANKGNFPKI